MANNRYLTPKNETTVTRFVIAIVLYFLLRSIIKRGAKQAAQDAILSGDNNALIAVEMRQAMNPSGTSWLMDFDGTDTDALFNSARKATDFPAVARAYANLYDADLLTDLQNELSAPDFAKLQSLIGKGGGTGKAYARFNNTPAFSAKGEGDNWEIDFSSPATTFNAGELLAEDIIANAVYTNAKGEEFKYYIFKVSSYFIFFETVAVDVKNIIEK